MAGVLWILFWIVLVLLAVVIAVLATPVLLAVSAATEPLARSRVAVRLLGGWTPPIVIHDSARPRDKPPARRSKTEPADKPRKKRRRERGSGRTFVRVRRGMAATPRLLVDIVGKVHIDRLLVDADIGLGDPADTGQVMGLVSALVYARRPRRNVSVAIRPDFTGARIDGRLDAVLSIVPMALVPPGLVFAWRIYVGARPWR